MLARNREYPGTDCDRLMNVTPDNNIAPVPPSAPRPIADTPTERYLAYLDYAFLPEAHRRRYAIATSLLAASIALSLGAGYLGATTSVWAWLGVPIGLLLVARSLMMMHKMVRRAQQYQRRKDVARKGELVTAYLVQTNTALLRPGSETALPCRVLFSFQPEVGEDAEYMRYLTERVASLRDKLPRGDMDQQYVAALASELRATPNRRYLLPLSFTDGSTVYLADLFVSRTHLPGGYLQSATIPCLAEQGATGGIELLPEWLLEPVNAPKRKVETKTFSEEEPPFPLG